jgi:hypothetical protein
VKSDPETAGSAASIIASIATTAASGTTRRKTGNPPVFNQAITPLENHEARRGGIDSFIGGQRLNSFLNSTREQPQSKPLIKPAARDAGIVERSFLPASPFSRCCR